MIIDGENYQVDYGQPVFYTSGDISLTSNSDSASDSIKIGKDPVWVYDIEVTGYDNAGIKIHDQNDAADKFSIKLNDSNNQDYQNDPFDLMSLNNLSKLVSFPGLIYRGLTEISMEIKAQGIPSSAALTFPVKFEVILKTFKLKKVPMATISKTAHDTGQHAIRNLQ